MFRRLQLFLLKVLALWGQLFYFRENVSMRLGWQTVGGFEAAKVQGSTQKAVLSFLNSVNFGLKQVNQYEILSQPNLLTQFLGSKGLVNVSMKFRVASVKCNSVVV